MDNDMKNWKVPDKFQSDLDEIKTTYKAEPLRVYLHDIFIEPTELEHVLVNALVKISFTIHHTYIKKDNSWSKLLQGSNQTDHDIKATCVNNPSYPKPPVQGPSRRTKLHH
ncbi:hypothetical protein J3R82DRAFT_7687 [Butyriboletus roseoflavus]|nr:hypothetical protein J3R82DRAFT_7687 [Butyriboletus roseoflavus]